VKRGRIRWYIIVRASERGIIPPRLVRRLRRWWLRRWWWLRRRVEVLRLPFLRVVIAGINRLEFIYLLPKGLSKEPKDDDNLLVLSVKKLDILTCDSLTLSFKAPNWSRKP